MQTYEMAVMTPSTRYEAPTFTNAHTGYTAQLVSQLTPKQMPITALIQAHRIENERCCEQSPDQRYAYELFRRAGAEHNEIAWQHVCSEYAELVELWVQRCGGVGARVRRQWLVDAAFARFRQAITQFDTFPTLTSLLHHLQFCAAYVVVDAARSSAHTPAVISEQNNDDLERAVG